MLKNTFCQFATPAYLKLGLLMLCCLVTLCNCGAPGVSQKPPDLRIYIDPPVPSPPEQELDFNDSEKGKQIRRDYFNFLRDNRLDTIDDVWIGGYYGTYNDGFAIIMETIIPFPSPAVLRTTVIADIEFQYNSGLNIVFWHEGRFYRLQDAYDLGLLTQEDLKEISGKFLKQRAERLEQLGAYD